MISIKAITILFTLALLLCPNHLVLAKSKVKSLDIAKGFFKDGNIQAAFAECNKVIEKEPKNDEAYLLRGWLLLYANKPKRALLEFNKVIDLNPKNFNAYKSRCIIYRQLKEHELSDKNSKIATEIAPKDPEGLYLRAISLILDGNHKIAITYLDRAIDNGKDHPLLYHLYYWRGRTKQMLGDDKGAVGDLSKCLNLVEENKTKKFKPDADMTMSMAFFKTEYDTDVFQKNFGKLERATSYKNLGQYSKAVPDLTALLATDGKDSLLWEERGLNYLLNGEYKKALKDFNKALILGSHSTDLYLQIGVTNFCLKKYDRVPDLLDIWFKREGFKNDDSQFAYFLTYTSLIRSRKFKKAHEYLNMLDTKFSKKDTWDRTCFNVLRKSRCCSKLFSFIDTKQGKNFEKCHMMAGLFYSLVRKKNKAKSEFEQVLLSKKKASLEIAVAKAELSNIQ